LQVAPTASSGTGTTGTGTTGTGTTGPGTTGTGTGTAGTSSLPNEGNVGDAGATSSGSHDIAACAMGRAPASSGVLALLALAGALLGLKRRRA
jgi:MYXO-CTERM domain-containing protein